MQQSLRRPLDGTDPTYTTEDFLNAFTANKIRTAEPKQTDSPYHEAWILKRIAMIQTAVIGPAQQWYSQFPLDTKKNWQAFCRELRKKFDNQQSQTQAKFLLERITLASGEQNKTLAHHKKVRKPRMNYIGTTTSVRPTGRKNTPGRYYTDTHRQT